MVNFFGHLFLATLVQDHGFFSVIFWGCVANKRIKEVVGGILPPTALRGLKGPTHHPK